jgi:hypothetical protein
VDRPERSLLAKYGGASYLWSDTGAAGDVARTAFFGSPPVEYLYIGPTTRSARYRGAKTDAQIYLGPRALFPPPTVFLELYAGGVLELYAGGNLELYAVEPDALSLYAGGSLELYGGGSLNLYAPA